MGSSPAISGFCRDSGPHLRNSLVAVTSPHRECHPAQARHGSSSHRFVNYLARRPLGALFRRLGAPAHIVDAWLRALNQSKRVIIIQGVASEPVTSTASIPEGDPLGIASIAAYGALWSWQMLSLNTIPYAYADNLEYHCEPRFISSAADAKQAVHCAWRQLISYGKSWSWAPPSQAELPGRDIT